jgi:hypothetical protein
VTAPGPVSGEPGAVLLQTIGELGRGLAVLDQEVRTRQYAAARDSVATLQLLVQVLDSAAALVMAGTPYAQLRLCSQCGAVAEPGRTTCWAHG